MQPTITAYHAHLARHALPSLDAPRGAAYGAALVALAMLDLEPARSILERGFSPLGRRPRDQVQMLRSILLMALLGERSFNRWAPRLRREPLLAAMSGFPPDDCPGVGTFYDFMYRVLDGPAPPRAQHGWRRPSQRLRRRGRLLRMRRQAVRRPGRVRDEVQSATARLAQATGQRFAHRLNRILMRCAVRPSATAGILGAELDVAIDSSMLRTHARIGGVPADDIPPQDNWIFERSADPDAAFGFDSRVDGTVYGHRLHAAVASVGNRDLPLWIDVDAANEPDGAHAPRLLSGLHRMLKEERIDTRVAHVLADKGYDAEALYRFVAHLGARPVIQLNLRNVAQITPDGVERDDEGRPLCPAGAPMRLHQRANRHGKSTWGCPAKRRQRGGGVVFDPERCPDAADCMPQSKQGPWVNLSHRDDPRLNPLVPRGSTEEKTLLNKRSAVERVFGYMKTLGGLDARPYRRRHIFHIVSLCHAMALHAKAWMKAAFGGPPKDRASTLDCLARIFTAARQERAV